MHRAIAWYSVGRPEYNPRSNLNRPPKLAYIAPSWSWASVRDSRLQVLFLQHYKPGFNEAYWEGPPEILTQWEFPLEIMDIKVEHTGPDPMGGVSYGRLRVNGSLVYVDALDWEIVPFHRGHFFKLSRPNDSGGEHRIRIYLDDPVEEDEARETYIIPYQGFHCLLVAFADEDTSFNRHPRLKGIKRVTTAAVALLATGNSTDGVREYMRIGLLFVAEEVLFSEAAKTVVDIV